MHITEAIKLITNWQAGDDVTSFDDLNIAIRLGVEALKRIARQRRNIIPINQPPLPGETMV